MPNWKVPGPDGLHGFWRKKIASPHQATGKHLDDCIQTGYVPSWTLESRTVLLQKDAKKGNAVGNYIPIACLNLYQRNRKVVNKELKEQKISS